MNSTRALRLAAAFACAGAAVLVTASAASPAQRLSSKASFTAGFPPVLPSAIMGTLYPPKPYTTVSFCRPQLKFGKQCGDFTFKLGKGGAPPPGMSIDATSGAVIGLPRGHADTYQPKGSAAPGLYHFSVCAAEKQKKTVCKPTQLAVFSALGGVWKGSFQGDPGAFTCNTPLAGTITLTLTQKLSIVKSAPVSTLAGTATLTNLPPISTDGSQNGPCDQSDQTFGLGPGNVKNPGAGGSDSTKGVWNLQLLPNGTLSGSLTIQDSGGNGFFSELAFTATH